MKNEVVKFNIMKNLTMSFNCSIIKLKIIEKF